MVDFDILLKQCLKGHKAPKALLCFDPGETTGWALFLNGKLVEKGQIVTKDLVVAYTELTKLFQTKLPTHVTIEEYRVYAWKAANHTWSQVHTARIIGMLFYLHFTFVGPGSKPHLELAQGPKNFVTDSKLKKWNMYYSGKHSRDAIRHGLYYLLFIYPKLFC